MSDVAKPWAPASNAAIASMVRNMMKEGAGDDAFLFILEDACAARFDDLSEIIESLCPVRGVRLLFDSTLHDSPAAKITYELAGLPPAYFALFAASADFAREVARHRPSGMGQKARLFVLEKALTAKDVVDLALSNEFIGRIRLHLGHPDPDAATAS